jgi:vacuolar-type H+-ATPase subunit E/Vma4
LKEGREEARREAEEAREEARREAEEARRKALEEGREEGKLEALRIMLLDFIEARFPTRKMINLAKSQAAMIEDPDVLQSLILKVGLAQTAEEAQEYLISWPETYDGHE